MNSLAPGALLSRARAQKAGLISAAIIAPLVAGALLQPQLTQTFIERNLLLQSVDWPRAYFLRIEEPAQAETLLAVGDALTVQAVRERGGGARARIEAYFRTADGSESREELNLERRGDDTFRRVFSNVARDFRFRIHCGDFSSQWYSVAVRSRPRIEDISLTFDYPDYTGLDDGGGVRSVDTGHVKIPVGTMVSFVAQTSIPVREATRIESRRVGDGESRTEEELSIAGGRELRGSFPAEQSGFYHFRLVSTDGFENPSPIRYRIQIIDDQSPVVQITKPGRNLELSSRATFNIDLIVSDDYGVRSSEVLIFAEGTREDGEPLYVFPLEVPADASQQFEPKLELSLTEWNLEPGTRLEYFARAVDAIDQIGESRSWMLTILDEDELLRLVQDEVTMMRERLQETFELQRDVRRGVEELEDHARTAGGSLPEESLPSLRHQRLSQERVNSRIEEGVERFQELIDRVVENQLTDFKELPWIEGLRDRLDALSQETAQKGLEQLDELNDQAERGDVKTDSISDAVEPLRSTERQLQALVDELEEWGDVQTIIRKLEDLYQSEVKLENSLRDKIRESLGEGETPGGN